MFLLDTDVISSFRKTRPHPGLLRWFAEVQADEVAVSAFTVFELRAGVEIVRRNQPDKADEIASWVDGFVTSGGLRILPFDAEVASIYGVMFATPSLRDFLTPDPASRKLKSGADLVIAATAIVHGATLVTRNLKDHERIHRLFPLPALYDPFDDRWAVGGPAPAPVAP